MEYKLHYQCWSCEEQGAPGKHIQSTPSCPDCNALMELVPTVISTAYIDGHWLHDTVVGFTCGDLIVHRINQTDKKVHSVLMVANEDSDNPRPKRKRLNTKKLRSIAHT